MFRYFPVLVLTLAGGCDPLVMVDGRIFERPPSHEPSWKLIFVNPSAGSFDNLRPLKGVTVSAITKAGITGPSSVVELSTTDESGEFSFVAIARGFGGGAPPGGVETLVIEKEGYHPVRYLPVRKHRTVVILLAPKDRDM